jgi:hypothetical protein
MTCTWATAGGNKLCTGGYTGTSVAPAVWSSCSWPSSCPNVRSSRLRTHAPLRRSHADNSSGREPAALRRQSTVCAASSTAVRPAPPRLLHPRYWVAQRWRGVQAASAHGGPGPASFRRSSGPSSRLCVRCASVYGARPCGARQAPGARDAARARCRCPCRTRLQGVCPRACIARLRCA